MVDIATRSWYFILVMLCFKKNNRRRIKKDIYFGMFCCQCLVPTFGVVFDLL